MPGGMHSCTSLPHSLCWWRLWLAVLVVLFVTTLLLLLLLQFLRPACVPCTLCTCRSGHMPDAAAQACQPCAHTRATCAVLFTLLAGYLAALSLIFRSTAAAKSILHLSEGDVNQVPESLQCAWGSCSLPLLTRQSNEVEEDIGQLFTQVLTLSRRPRRQPRQTLLVTLPSGHQPQPQSSKR